MNIVFFWSLNAIRLWNHKHLIQATIRGKEYIGVLMLQNIFEDIIARNYPDYSDYVVYFQGSVAEWEGLDKKDVPSPLYKPHF